MRSGSRFATNQCGELEVVAYENSRKVTVRFIATGFTTVATAAHIRKGEVKDPLSPSVYGVGYVGVGDHAVSENGKKTKAYSTWKSMLERCYDPKFHESNPTYIGCAVCDEWHDFQAFAAWFHEHYVEGYQLDKDLIDINAKQYSPDTCLFVPSAVNKLLIDCGRARGVLPQGVTLEKNGKYKVGVRQDGKRKHIGRFTKLNHAVSAYWRVKAIVVYQTLASWANASPEAIQSVTDTFECKRDDSILAFLTDNYNPKQLAPFWG